MTASSNLESPNPPGRTVRHHLGDGGQGEFPRPVFAHEEDLVIRRENDRGPGMRQPDHMRHGTSWAPRVVTCAASTGAVQKSGAQSSWVIHCLVATSGESYRMRQARTTQGGRPKNS
jgi:hypothetical protein